jgi:transglutaminase-like putative cysteine protease
MLRYDEQKIDRRENVANPEYSDYAFVRETTRIEITADAPEKSDAIELTTAVVVGADHIVIARGRDYGDVSPVRGVLRIAGGQTSEQAVDVVPVAG